MKDSAGFMQRTRCVSNGGTSISPWPRGHPAGGRVCARFATGSLCDAGPGTGSPQASFPHPEQGVTVTPRLYVQLTLACSLASVGV